MKATGIKGLGANAQAQIRAALANGTGTPVVKKRAPKSTDEDVPRGMTLRCCAPGCGHEETSWQKMDAHCDDAGHHRYEAVLT